MIYYSTDNIKIKEGTIITMGKFDGVHIGHREIIQKLMDIKETTNLLTTILSYNPSPLEVLKGIKVKNIYTGQEKQEVLEDLGIDIYIEYPFTKNFSNLSAEDFVENILVDKLNCKYIVVGEDNRFGKNQLGDFNLLEKLGDKHGFTPIKIKSKSGNGSIISSSNIRDIIESGNIKLANKLLGRNFFVKEKIVVGNKIGRSINYPTINILTDKEKILPKNGVYITKTKIDGKVYNSMTNIGNNPTVNNDYISIESHIFDFDKDVYGKMAEIVFYDYLRKEIKFGNLKELKNEIKKDEEKVRNYFK